MKIDKKNPYHWLYLVLFSINIFIACVLRPFISTKSNKILLYGHKLNGNLKAIYDYALTNPSSHDMSFTFLTIDPAYHKTLKDKGILTSLGIMPTTIRHLIQCKIIISDHGLHSLVFLLKHSSIKFVDVWHGIPFKGFDDQDFVIQHQYDEVWVSSERLKELYVSKFGFDKGIIKAIGYTRTDILINKNLDTSQLKSLLGVTGKKVILYAPTWKQDDNDRTIFPFGTDETTFLSTLDAIAESTDTKCIIRAHLNYQLEEKKNYKNLIFADARQFPVTEEILLISDMLICDWSSIAFDYLLLDRPTLFLDTTAPFAKGFSLGPEYRFGKIINGIDELNISITTYLNSPQQYLTNYVDKIQKTKQTVYNDCADGKASQRAIARLNELLKD